MPAEVSDAADDDAAPDFISVLGASNAGKTVYLGLLLDLLSSPSSPIAGAARGPFSITLQEQVVTALQRRRFPAKTPTESDAWNWLHCEVADRQAKKAKRFEFITPDVAGEALAAELHQSGLYPAIKHVISRSRGFLLLCDSEQVRDAGAQEDLFAVKLASYITQLHQHRDRSKRSAAQPSVAVVFTKSDTSPEAELAPDRFAANNMPRLVDFCQRNFGSHKFFATSVVGSSCLIGDDITGYQQIPLHIEPRGVIEPLQWVIGQC
jgi:hypothetical protein